MTFTGDEAKEFMDQERERVDKLEAEMLANLDGIDANKRGFVITKGPALVGLSRSVRLTVAARQRLEHC